jgi:hypothetical protein
LAAVASSLFGIHAGRESPLVNISSALIRFCQFAKVNEARIWPAFCG